MDEKLEKKRNKKLADRERQRKLKLDDFVRAACKTQEGREYLWWLMEICKVAQQPFTGNALGTSFNCGELNIGIQIRDQLINATPQGYLNILTEKQKEEEDDRTNSDTDTGPDAEA